LRLKNYITFSFLLHLILVWGLSHTLIHLRQKVPADVIFVHIPEAKDKVPEAVKPPPSLQRHMKPIPRRRRRRHLPEEVKPETMFGGLTSDTHTEEDSAQTGSSEVKTGEDSKTGQETSKEAGVRISPSELFDREIIEKYAKVASPRHRGLSFDTGEFKHRGYLRMLKERIENVWQYPKEAANRGISGDLYIRFTINRDGSLGGVELVRTSGFRILDRAAIQALRDAEPYWPLPDDWEKDTLEITGHFIYIYGIGYMM